MKVKLYQMNVKNTFLNEDLNVDVSLYAPTNMNNMECVNMRNNKDLMIDTVLGRMTKHCVQRMLTEFELSMVEYVFK